MEVRALHMVRILVIAALFPALAGCAIQDGEALQRGDIQHGDPPTDAIIPDWADEFTALVRPGIIIQTETRNCLSNFLFVRPDNGAVFLGTTAYCVRDMPIGTPAIVGDATDVAILVYNSAQTMADAGETDADALEYNDFALFLLDSRTVRKSNPTLPVVGGPAGLADGRTHATGDRLRAFARSEELPRETDWRQGVVSGRAGEWAILAYEALPVAPGTTGGAVIDDQGNAVGIMVTLGVVPNPGANGVARLDTVLDYTRTKGRIPLELATAS